MRHVYICQAQACLAHGRATFADNDAVVYLVDGCDRQPATLTQAPVIREARSEARNVTIAEISSGLPKRPSGISVRTKFSMKTGFSCWRRSHEPPGNRTEPGTTTFTIIPSLASDLDQLFM